MTKNEFLTNLRNELNSIKADDIDKTISYYSEMIDDRIDAGMSEDDAVNKMGSIEDIINATKNNLEENTVTTPVKKISPWEIVIIIIGLPLWLPLLIAGCAVIIAMYVVIWAVIVSLWAALFAFAVGSIALTCMAIMALGSNFITSLFYIGIALMCAGLAILLFKPILAFTKFIIEYTAKGCKLMAKSIKKGFSHLKARMAKEETEVK